MMKIPARPKDSGAKIRAQDAVTQTTTSRMAEIGALATAASALALGVAQAKEQALAKDRHMPNVQPDDLRETQEQAVDDRRHLDDIGQLARIAAQTYNGHDNQPQTHDPMPAAQTPSVEAGVQDLSARIAEQIASGVHSLLGSVQAGADPAVAAQAVAADILGKAHEIATGITEKFDAANEASGPLNLADTINNTISTHLDGLQAGIKSTVDAALDQSGVIDLLNGNAKAALPIDIADGVIADLQGVTGAIDLAGIAQPVADAAIQIPADILGGNQHGHNPLAELFYDDGGAGSAATDALDLSGAGDVVKLGFLAQPMDHGGEIGGLLQATNALHLL